jgi:hypothetical protein
VFKIAQDVFSGLTPQVLALLDRPRARRARARRRERMVGVGATRRMARADAPSSASGRAT